MKLGKKVILTIIGSLLCTGIVAAGIYFKIDGNLITQVVGLIGGLFGLTISTHFITDVTSIIKGSTTVVAEVKEVVKDVKAQAAVAA